MVRYGYLMLLAFGLLSWTGRVTAQEAPTLPPQPVPVAAPSEPVVVTTLPHPQFTDASPAPYPAPPPPGPPPAVVLGDDNNVGVLAGGPVVDWCGLQRSGWFLALDYDSLQPHIKGMLVGNLNVGNTFTDVVALPNVPLDWVGSPRIDVGYRFDQGTGEVLVSYRSLVSQGDGVITNYDPYGDAEWRSRLNLNVLDVDYGQHESFLGPHWDIKWEAGVRVAGLFFDTSAVGTVLEQHSSSNFVGAGPHVALEWSRELGWHGLAIVSRVEGAVLWGQTRQSFDEQANTVDGLLGGATRISHTQAVPDVSAELGLGWRPWAERPFRLMAGYEFEGWWYVGKAGASSGDLTVQGVFFRAEVNY